MRRVFPEYGFKSRNIVVQSPGHYPISPSRTETLISGHSGLPWTQQAVRSPHPCPALLGEGHLSVTNLGGMFLSSALLLPVFAHPPGLPPPTPRRTYSASSSTKRHLRTRGSSNCAGPARRAHRENTQAAAAGQPRPPHPEKPLSPLLGFIWRDVYSRSGDGAFGPYEEQCVETGFKSQCFHVLPGWLCGCNLSQSQFLRL